MQKSISLLLHPFHRYWRHSYTHHTSLYISTATTLFIVCKKTWKSGRATSGHFADTQTWRSVNMWLRGQKRKTTMERKLVMDRIHQSIHVTSQRKQTRTSKKVRKEKWRWQSRRRPVSECRNEQTVQQTPGDSDDESDGQCGDQEEECRAATLARDPGAPTTAEIAKHAASHRPYRNWSLHCIRRRGGSRQHRTDKSSKRTITLMGAEHCFIGGEMAAHESPVFVMVDTETSVVFTLYA